MSRACPRRRSRTTGCRQATRRASVPTAAPSPLVHPSRPVEVPVLAAPDESHRVLWRIAIVARTTPNVAIRRARGPGRTGCGARIPGECEAVRGVDQDPLRVTQGRIAINGPEVATREVVPADLERRRRSSAAGSAAGHDEVGRCECDPRAGLEPTFVARAQRSRPLGPLVRSHRGRALPSRRDRSRSMSHALPTARRQMPRARGVHRGRSGGSAGPRQGPPSDPPSATTGGPPCRRPGPRRDR